jgi:hypothetical protein
MSYKSVEDSFVEARGDQPTLSAVAVESETPPVFRGFSYDRFPERSQAAHRKLPDVDLLPRLVHRRERRIRPQ